MRLLLIIIISLLYAMDLYSFPLFPSGEERFSVISIEYLDRAKLVQEQHDKYSQSVAVWRAKKSDKNLKEMRLQKKLLSNKKRTVKSGALVVRCTNRRFEDQLTVSIKAHGEKSFEFVGKHTFIGLSDSMRMYLDLKPKRVVVFDHVSKKVWEFEL